MDYAVNTIAILIMLICFGVGFVEIVDGYKAKHFIIGILLVIFAGFIAYGLATQCENSMEHAQC